MATIKGTTGNDHLTGTTAGDQIDARSGNDMLEGGLGSDTLTGGRGHDRFDGGADGDTFYNDGGDDTFIGGAGNDYLYALLDRPNSDSGAGNDLAFGGKGNDYFYGGAGNDKIYGGEGADTLAGGNGADLLNGNGGDDVLLFDLVPDRINGGVGGADRLDVRTVDLDLTAIANGKIRNIEIIDLTYEAAQAYFDNTLTLSKADLLDISSTSNTLTVLGQSVDSVNIVGRFEDLGVSNGFHKYKLGAGILLVDTDITDVK